MDTSLIIVSLLLVGSVFLPFFLLSKLGKKEIKKLKSECKSVKSKNNLKIAQEEFWANSYIGVDTDQKKLVFIKTSESERIEHILDLNRIKGCKVLEQRKVLKIKDKKDSQLEKLNLEISFKNGENMHLSFYDADQKYSEDFENQRTEKWKAIILKHISVSDFPKKAA